MTMTAARATSGRPHALPAPLRTLRDRARRAFASMADPDLRYGLQIGFDPKLVALPYAGNGPKDARVRIAAPPEIRTVPGRDAFRSRTAGADIGKLFAPSPSDRIDAFLRARIGDGTAIVIPRGTVARSPVRIDIDIPSGPSWDDLVIVAEPGSRATVILHGSGPARGNGSHGSTVSAIVGKGADLTVISLQNAGAVTDIAVRRALAQADARIAWLDCVFGGTHARSTTSTVLSGQGAHAAHRTLFFGDAERRFDLATETIHAAPRTSSTIDVRGALTDTAKALCRGLIRMERGSSGATGTQSLRTLLLSAEAEADAIPNLEIEEADVRCGHGAAIGTLDREQLFYLRSRGLSPIEARRTLVDGFLAPIVKEMAAWGLEEAASCIISERLRREA